MNSLSVSCLFLLALTAAQVQAFVSNPLAAPFIGSRVGSATNTRLFAGEAAADKAAPMVTGAELEIMLTEWEEPLVIDAYATW
jgi:hypothetical protein